jgi:hypothetical protein
VYGDSWRTEPIHPSSPRDQKTLTSIDQQEVYNYTGQLYLAEENDSQLSEIFQ